MFWQSYNTKEPSMRQARQNEDTKAPGGKIQEEPSFQQGLPGDRGGKQQKMAEIQLQCCC